MGELSRNISIQVFSSDDELTAFLCQNAWLDGQNFCKICEKFGFPSCGLTLVIENYHIDVAYRDIYYHYWASFHFDWPRYCQRLFLFQHEHAPEEFYTDKYDLNLKDDFLGVIVVRPPYGGETDHTFGRTLLNPYKMRYVSGDKKKRAGLLNVKTAEYKFHLLGNTYTVQAFPFSSQDGVVMKCAETAIYNLCDFAATSSAQYAMVLPSNIQEKLEKRLPERILPSHGLYCNDMSFLLKEFGFSPMIYANEKNYDSAEGLCPNQDSRIGTIAPSESFNAGEAENSLESELPHATNYKNWFRYYVESSIPVIAITRPSEDVNKHAALVIGRGMERKSIKSCKLYQLEELWCVDTTELYDDYIVQDDNQIPYCEEKLDHFTQGKNYKLDAFIVPLDRHVFLDAPSAVSIFDAIICQDHHLISRVIGQIKEGYLALLDDKRRDKDYENLKQQIEFMVNAMSLSKDNPVAIRYFLTNSAEYKQFRFINSSLREDKIFYSDILMPKFVWVAEISTYELYKMGYACAEIVLDATASKRSHVNSIILLRMANSGIMRRPDEPYRSMGDQIKEDESNKKLSSVFPIYCKSISDEWDAEEYT